LGWLIEDRHEVVEALERVKHTSTDVETGSQRSMLIKRADIQSLGEVYCRACTVEGNIYSCSIHKPSLVPRGPEQIIVEGQGSVEGGRDALDRGILILTSEGEPRMLISGRGRMMRLKVAEDRIDVERHVRVC